MIRQVILFCIVASAYSQYPRQRAPPHYQGPPVEEFVEDYNPPRQAPPPRPAAPPQALRANPRQSDVYRPASVHYVNIGHELAGDYKFGYDTGKGNDGQSFREETRLPDGSVQGAYGYVDETGQQRIVKYTAGKEGFKVLGDDAAKNTPRSTPARQPAPAQPQPAPQQSYNPPPQQSYAPEPQQPAPRQQPQPAYRPAPQPQPAYRSPAPQPQPAYRPPAPQPQQEYRAPPQQSYAPRSRQAARPQQRPRYQEPRPQPEDSYDDYDYPNNDISERRLVPVDTTLFNYNIGTSQSKR